MFKLSDEGLEQVKKELRRYETIESAIIPSLFIVQKENNGWISAGAIEYLSKVMEIPKTRIDEVFKFYTMFNQKPVGRYHIQVCTNIACSVGKGRELVQHILSELKVKPHEVTSDGLYSVSPVECLGSCGTSPVMQINENYHESVTPESAMNIIRGLK